MSVLKLKLLGQMECVTAENVLLTLSTRKSEVLLAYLALAPGVRHPRERLINLLWSDRSEEQARNSLRQALSAIKKSLDATSPDLLEVDRTTVRINPDLIQVDAHEFDALAAQTDIDNLSAAAALYQGEFLEGIMIRDAASQEWLSNERDRCKRQIVEVLSSLSHLQISNGFHREAIESAERLVVHDPLHEHGWRMLMRAYHEKGDRNHALLTYKRCSQVLNHELGIEPEAETNELRDSLVSGTLEHELSKSVAPITNAVRTRSPTPDPGDIDHSILVLPFENLSNDPDQQYFSDGLTEGIIMGLSLFPSLKVHSRNSSFAAAAQNLSMKEIEREFQSLYVVEGSVRKSSDQVRISAHLVNTANGEQIWGKRFDSSFEESFSLEDQVTQSIVAIIKGKIDITDQEIAYRKPAKDMQSYDLLMRGRFHLVRFNPEDNRIGNELLQKCLHGDPDNAAAHNDIYRCYILDWLSAWTAPRSQSLENAGDHIKKAIELEPDNSIIQASYAEYLVFIKEFEQAAAHANRAIALNPNDTETIATISAVEASMGNIDTAINMADACRRLDPFHPWVDWVTGIAYYRGKKYQNALQAFKNMPNPADEIDGWIAACYQRLGDQENAEKYLNMYLDIARQNMAIFPESLEGWQNIWSSTAAYRHQDGIDYPFEALCSAGLKQFVETTAATDSQEDLHSIAVLPFDNLSGDPEQEYFSDGITESIILNLTLFPGLQVKSRNSSFAFKQQIKSLGEISKELAVDYIVEGSIRKSDDRVRITVQLIEADSGNQIWGNRYESSSSQLFELEAELSRQIAATVTGQIESDLERIAIAKSAADQKSYDLLLAGRYYCYKFTKQNMEIAVKYLEQCLEQDPHNVHAHSMLYLCHVMNWMERWTEDYKESFRLAGEHSGKAIELDPDNVFVQWTHAEYQIFCREYDKASIHVNKALAMNPNDPDSLATKAFNLSMLGEYDLAIECAEASEKLDPYHPWASWYLAEIELLIGRPQSAIDTILNSITPPGLFKPLLVIAYSRTGENEKARQTMQEFLQNSRDSMPSIPKTREEWSEYWLNNSPYQDVSIVESLLEDLMQMGLCDDIGEVTEELDKTQLPTIVVLPFDNLSGDPQQEYFSDGITESVILSLSSFKELTVKSRHSSFAFKSSDKNIKEIGEELEVQYIVEGSVRNSPNKVRVTVQLVEANSGNQIWGKRYDAELDQLFELEEELSQTIAGTIYGRIGKQVKLSKYQKPAKNLKSYDYLMRGWYHAEKLNVTDTNISIAQLQKCIEIDPKNADAQALIAVEYHVLLFENWSVDRPKTLDLANQHIEKALELEPDSAIVHGFMSENLFLRRDFERALFHADKAIELNPTFPDGYSMKAMALAVVRRHEEAVELAERSLQLDPYHPYSGWNAGEVFHSAGELERAIQAYRSIPHTPPSLIAQIAACLVDLGKIDAARVEMKAYHEMARQQMPVYPSTVAQWRQLWHENYPFQFEEDFEALFDSLLKAGLCDEVEDRTDDMPSIAVLPFENMSGDPEQEYFSDGITSDIIATLSKFRGIHVVARHSTLVYKERKASLDEIAAEQRVRYILEGSIRKSGNRIRVIAELIDSRSGENCWSESYDRELDDIFAVQDEITLNITVAMKVHLNAGDRARGHASGTKSVKAWELCTRAADFEDSYIRDNINKARGLVTSALEIDPDYSFAWITLGWLHWQEVYLAWTDSIDAALDKAENAAQKALELEPENADAWILTGTILQARGKAQEGIIACQKAVLIAPGNSEAQALTGFSYVYAGEPEKALPYYQASLRLAPNCPNWYLLVGGGIHQSKGDLPKAIEIYQKAVDVEPESPLARIFLMDTLIEAGHLEKAKIIAGEIRALDEAFKVSGIIRLNSHDPIKRNRFQANMEKMGFNE